MKKQLTLTFFLFFSLTTLIAEQWIQRFIGTGNNTDQITAMSVDNAGNVYVTGYSFGSNDNDYVTIKYNANVRQWLARYNGPGNGNDIPAASLWMVRLCNRLKRPAY